MTTDQTIDGVRREMWDSLATCPYCNATFFYESRYLRVDAAFKGFF